MPDRLDIGENSPGEKLKVRDAKLKLDTENAGWWLSCAENIFSGERSLDGFIPLDALIASVLMRLLSGPRKSQGWGTDCGGSMIVCHNDKNNCLLCSFQCIQCVQRFIK